MPFTGNDAAHVWPTARADKYQDAADTVDSSGRIGKLECTSIRPMIRYALRRALRLDNVSAIHPLTSRNSDRNSIDVLRLEGLLRMAVTLHGYQLAYPASARMIALAIQNEVDGFRRLRTNE